ncbi:GNAT family N-acetyltransferase [Neobacillus rhizophilus]|uniref:GNAT family N-acetyltransferase n=1 Tax=Neobacillus rhizophilus TaxID=2833579 RepID=A0A942U4P9_9BACI|nr:GNAT family N-acetyltransferase [Neobacillus rhizophilus]MBS4211504.1 GNAT family N-acetyltransferase [Neobacillus rhizophilus]
MIQIIDMKNLSLANDLYNLQRSAYLVEARIVGFDDIPPLKESFEEFLISGESFLGFFEMGELTGAVSFETEGKELTICRMVVDPKHFRKGIAEKLLNAVEDIDQNIQVFKVSTGKDNQPAKNLYQKNGFKLVEDMEAAPGFFISHFEKTRP